MLGYLKHYCKRDLTWLLEPLQFSLQTGAQNLQPDNLLFTIHLLLQLTFLPMEISDQLLLATTVHMQHHNTNWVGATANVERLYNVLESNGSKKESKQNVQLVYLMEVLV